MRIVYLGTSEFAAAVLARLAESPHRPQLVVTRPDRPRGRGRRLQSPPVADAARALEFTLDQPLSVNDDDARARIAATRPDAVVVCAFGALIKEPLLSDQLVLNVHPSLLPRWRGAAPVERAIMAGDAETGVCIMRLTAGLDTGPVAREAREPIAPDDTYGTLAERLQTLGGELLVDALDALAAGGPGPGGLTFDEQPDDGVTYAEKLTAPDRILDPARTAPELDRTVRALTPHIGAAVLTGEGDRPERLGVWASTPREATPGDPPAGELGVAGDRPALGCAGDTTLVLDTVQPPGGRPMDAAAYLRGRGGR